MGKKTFELLKKLRYSGQNYGTIPRIVELRLTEEKNGRLPNTKKL